LVCSKALDYEGKEADIRELVIEEMDQR
jgi:hypothetical protein